jgi:hypothetical protein
MATKFLALCLLASLSAGGCSLTKKNIIGGSDGSAQFYAVTAASAPFYKFGPQQGNGPDMKLPRDTLVTLIRPSFGYSKVHLANGEEGYVASEDIKVAPADLVAAANAPPPSAEPDHHGERFNLNSNDPRLIVPPEELPENNPEPTPLPGVSPN